MVLYVRLSISSAEIRVTLPGACRIAVSDPVYPVYVDTNVMAGRTGDADDAGQYGGLTYLPISAENGFTAQIPSEKVDLIYLCFPNNPTGAVYPDELLQQLVEVKLLTAKEARQASIKPEITTSLGQTLLLRDCREQDVARRQPDVGARRPVCRRCAQCRAVAPGQHHEHSEQANPATPSARVAGKTPVPVVM